MKQIKIAYDPLYSRMDVQTPLRNIEAIGLLQMAIRHLQDLELISGRKNRETPFKHTNGSLEEPWIPVSISDAMGDAISRKLFRHSSRPQTMGDLVKIPSADFLRISGIGHSTIIAIRNYYSQYSIFWK